MDLDNSIEKLEQLIAEVREASLADTKTILGNALSLDRQARLIGEGKSPYQVVVFGDLNGFKRINDEHSHAAGDAALSKVGEIISQQVVAPLGGLAFRQSGDEFVIFLKRDDLNEFLSIVPVLGAIPFSHKGSKLRVAMSFGYTFTDPKLSFDDLLARAELACQSAKLLGDGVCLQWSQEFRSSPTVRLDGICQGCNAKISCNVVNQNAPDGLRFCPCCGNPLTPVAGN